MKNEQNRYEYLSKIQNQMRKIRSIRLDKNFNIIKLFLTIYYLIKHFYIFL